jgi:hypothetical protein
MKMNGKKFALNGDADNQDRKIGQGEFANMPQSVTMETYPKSRLENGNLPDDIKRIDRENDQMQSKRPRFRSNQH